MKNFQQSTKLRNVLHSKPVLILFGVLVLFFAWNVIGLMGKMQVTIENKKVAESKLAELKKEKENLSSEISKLQTDSGKEASIRERFPVAKEGESVVVIIEDKNKPTTTDVAPEGFFSSIKNWFSN